MNKRGNTVRRVLTGLAAVALTGGLALAVSSPAQADANPAYGFAKSTSASFTDSATPTKSFGGTDGPYWIGSWQDPNGVSHQSKAYFTFDLSAYKGAQIEDANFIVDENSVNNCAVDRQIALWQTDTPATKITWDNAPAETRKVFSGKDIAPYGCPSTYYGFEAKSLITSDLAGTGIITVEVSVPGTYASNPDYGRSLTSLGLQLTYDHAPDVPANLTINGVACGSKQILINALTPEVTADLTDPDGTNSGFDNGNGPMTGTVEIWPSADPNLVTTFSEGAEYAPTQLFAYVPDGVLVDGGTYVMRIQNSDGILTSKWSAPCRFGVDTTGPANPPTVTSTDYPGGIGAQASGGVNVPGTFTFSADGDKSVVGFWYGEYSAQTYVAANKPGGTATVTITPTQPAVYQLEVASADKALNRSPATEYYFYVKDNSPTIVDANPGAKFRIAHTLTFTPRQDGTIAYYIYDFNNEGQQTVAAGPDGSAQIQITPENDQENGIVVSSVNTDNLQSGPANYYMYVTTAPTVSSVQYPQSGISGGIGVRGTFTFTPGYAGIVSYTYAFDNGLTQNIAANANGKATVHWTPTTSGAHSVEVTSTDNTGLVSDQARYTFDVNSNQPAITSDVYQNFQQSGGLGVPGTFTFTANQTGATSFVYQFGYDAPTQTVPVGSDGTASVVLTPTIAGLTHLTVYTVNAAGTQSDPTQFGIIVDPQAPTLTYTASGDGVFTFTATAVLPGSTSFIWSLDGGDNHTVPVGADGTATFSVTPDSGEGHDVSVYTTAGDLSSGMTYSYFYAP